MTQESHASERTIKDVFEAMTEEQKNAAAWLVMLAKIHKYFYSQASAKRFWKNITAYEPVFERTVLGTYNAMSQEQKTVVHFFVDQILA